MIEMNTRYDRQIACSFIGIEKQEQIIQSRAAVIGCGALGNIIADILTRAGVGTLLLLDFDTVDESNLQRQVLFTEKDIGKKKVVCARERLSLVNSQVKVKISETRLTEENCSDILGGYSVLLDATDDIQTSLVLNGFAVRNTVPMVFGGIAGEQGNIMVYLPGGPCLACVAPSDLSGVPTAQTLGIIPSLPAVAGGIMASEALKCIIDPPAVLRQWWKIHLWKASSSLYSLDKNPQCAVCRDY